MLALLRSTRLTRWTVFTVWLAFAAAVLGPVLHPSESTLVCSASGQLRFVPLGDGDASDEAPPMTMGDCALCVAALPPALPVATPPLPPAPRRVASLHDRVPAGVPPAAPPPARGPPALT